MARETERFEGTGAKLAERMVEAVDVLDRLDETPSAAGTSFAELYAYATDAGHQPRPQLLEVLAQSPRLRADLARLLRNMARRWLPQVAAASSGEVRTREGRGCRIRLRPSRADPAQVYVIIEIEDDTPSPASTMFIYDPSGCCLKVALPPAQDGRIQLLIDGESDVARGLRNVVTEVFLR